MGKGGGGGPTTQTIQPSLPALPNEATLQSQAQQRLGASSPWMNSPWRSMDLIGGQAPVQYLPQFTPPGQQGMQQGSTGPSTQFYGGPGTGQQAGVPGFYNPASPQGSPMQMPGTAVGQAALSQNTSPGLVGMTQFLQQISQQGQQGGQASTPPTQPAQNAAPPPAPAQSSGTPPQAAPASPAPAQNANPIIQFLQHLAQGGGGSNLGGFPIQGVGFQQQLQTGNGMLSPTPPRQLQ